MIFQILYNRNITSKEITDSIVMFHHFVIVEILSILLISSVCFSQGVLCDDWLRKYLEELKEILKNGDEEIGVPKLDPYFLNVDFIVDNQPKINASVHMEGVLSNFSNYIVNDANLGKNLSSYFLLTFINPIFKGRFCINGTVMTIIPIDSEGILQIVLNQLVILMNSQIEAQNQIIQIQDISVAYTLNDSEVILEGLLRDYGFTYLLKDVIYDVVFTFLTKYRNAIQNEIKNAILGIGNTELKQVGLRLLIETFKRKYLF